MADDIRKLISAALKKVDKDDAQMVADPKTEIKRYPAPFLKRHEIYKITYFNPHKPIIFFVGYAPGEPAYGLTGAPENYVRMAKCDGVAIDSGEKATGYAVAYLEVTRNMSRLFYVAQSMADVTFRPNLDEEGERMKTAFIEKYGQVITAAAAEPASDGYVVKVYAVREQALELHSLTINKQGDVVDNVTVLEKGLPLVYGL